MILRCTLFVLSFGLSACSLANTEPPPSHLPWRADLSMHGPGADLAGAVDAATDQGKPGPASPLVVNEVFPHGADTMTDPDFIELYNGGSGQVNLRGYKVRDDGATLYALPDDAVIPSGGFYLINCDDGMGTTLPGAHVPFKLGGSGDEVHFHAPDGTELDSVAWGTGKLEVPKGQSLGRIPDQTGPFTVLPKPSRGKPNQ